MPSTHEVVRDGFEVLLGMLQHKGRQADAGAARERFRQVLGDEPSFALDLPGWHCHLVAPRSEVRLSADGRVALVFHGQLYDPPAGDAAAAALERYLERGRDFVHGLNGSFRLFVFDARQDCALVVTDHLASRMVFAGGGGGELWLVTSPGLVPAMDARPLDPAGIADYMTNGIIHAGRTIFAGARMLEHACVHEATPAGWSSRRHWLYELLSPGRADERELSEELLALVRRAVARRIRRRPIAVSLSGGYDSGSALGILTEQVPPAEMLALSYSDGKPRPDSDPDIAAQVARLCGVPHEAVDSYDGDFWGTLDTNVRTAMGYGEFCNEPHFWHRLRGMAREGRCGTVFFADECWGLMDVRLICRHDVMTFLGMCPVVELQPLRACVPAASFRAMEEAQRRMQDEIWARAAHVTNWHDRKDWLHLDQRQPHRTLPWHELNLVPELAVGNPFLDDDILDFMKRVPRRLRLEKTLFIRTMERHYPQVFRVPRAKLHGTHPDWRGLFLAHAAELETRARAQASRLDGLFPPATVGWLLERMRTGEPMSRPGGWRRLVRSAARVAASLGPVADGTARPLLDRLAPCPDATILLKRLLALRLWLTPEHARATPLSPDR